MAGRKPKPTATKKLEMKWKIVSTIKGWTEYEILRAGV